MEDEIRLIEASTSRTSKGSCGGRLPQLNLNHNKINEFTRKVVEWIYFNNGENGSYNEEKRVWLFGMKQVFNYWEDLQNWAGYNRDAFLFICVNWINKSFCFCWQNKLISWRGFIHLKEVHFSERNGQEIKWCRCTPYPETKIKPWKFDHFDEVGNRIHSKNVTKFIAIPPKIWSIIRKKSIASKVIEESCINCWIYQWKRPIIQRISMIY